MYRTSLQAVANATAPIRNSMVGEVRVQALTREHEAEVLTFLAQRPIHTVAMVGFIYDNGLVSPLNRGTFYGCRNRQGQLEGVALIGHATLLETTTDRALEALAEVAQTCTTGHMIMGEKERMNDFWDYYAGAGQDMRHVCRELLFELQWPVEALAEVPGLRLATLDELELIMPVHAQMAFDESGVNPLERDPESFRKRCARRIEKVAPGFGLKPVRWSSRQMLCPILLQSSILKVCGQSPSVVLKATACLVCRNLRAHCCVARSRSAFS